MLYSNILIDIQGLTIDDLEDLIADIKVYMELEEGNNAQFWKVCTDHCNYV